MGGDTVALFDTGGEAVCERVLVNVMLAVAPVDPASSRAVESIVDWINSTEVMPRGVDDDSTIVID